MNKILGRAEQVDFPDYKLFNLPAKVDTGAYSSSIDYSFAEIIEKDGRKTLEFILLHPGQVGYTGQKIATEDFDQTEITNANGVQQRFVIFPEMQVEGEKRRCRLTLADRTKLRYPVLIGRRFIKEGGYLVDVQQGQGLPDDEEEREL